ncbi:amidohydrolase family protein [Streptomyces sp. NPDC004134]|uniref:amidohydrolase family protein n=1 Tax=Streptomyces sp. NPDC004134 TaxID=3364691 RepID=UPI0036CECE96
MRVVDVNRILGPVPHDDVPGRDADGLRGELDRLRIDEAWVVHSHAVYGDPLTVPPVEEDRLLAVPVVIPGPLGTGEPPPVPVVRLYPAAHRFSLGDDGSDHDHDHGDGDGDGDGDHDGARLLRQLGERRTVTLVDWEQLDAAGRRRLSRRPGLPPLVLTGTGYRSLRELAGLLARCAHLYVDTSTLCGHRQVEWVAERFGAHRVLFGTGSPLTDDAGPRFQLDHLDLPAADVARIAAGNADRLVREAGGAHVAGERGSRTGGQEAGG